MTQDIQSTSIDMCQLISARALASVPTARDAFLHAEPFPHVVVDGFLGERFAEALVSDFPARDEAYEQRCIGEDGAPSPNYSNGDPQTFPPSFKTLDLLMRDPAFLALLGEMTGIPALEYDEEYFGGGIRESSGRTFLPPHIDFNHHPRRMIHRRLNLLLYLNKDWQEQWGGNLQIHRDPRVHADSLVHSYAPSFNRCLIFETSETSWHGFDHLQAPQGRARRAFTIYFYTKSRPGENAVEWHNTEYVEPPLPVHFKEGYRLTAEDVAFLQEAYTRRDGRISMLYALRREFDARFRHVWNEYEYYLNAWKDATGKS